MDRERLLLHLQGAEERAIGARLVDLAERALRDDRPLASDFLDPLGQKIAQSILGSIPEVSYRAYGGYPKAERRRLLIFPEYDSHEEFDEPIAALDLTLESKFDGAGHRDCLGQRSWARASSGTRWAISSSRAGASRRSSLWRSPIFF